MKGERVECMIKELLPFLLCLSRFALVHVLPARSRSTLLALANSSNHKEKRLWLSVRDHTTMNWIMMKLGLLHTVFILLKTTQKGI